MYINITQNYKLVNEAYNTFACMLLKIAEGALILYHVLLEIPCPSLERPVFQNVCILLTVQCILQLKSIHVYTFVFV